MSENRVVGENISSLTVALLVCAQYLSVVLSLYTSGSENGFFTQIMIVIIVLMIISFIFKPITIIPRQCVILLLLIIYAYIATSFFCGNKSNLVITEFICMCLLPMVCGVFLRPNYKKVLTCSMAMSYFAIPVFPLLFAKANASSVYDAVTMGTSYAILPVIVAGILHFFFYRKKSNPFEKITYIVTAIFLVSFITLSYRGALIALVVILLLGYIFSAEYKKSRKRFYFIVVLLLIVMLCVSLLINTSILNWLESVLESYGIEIAFIQKSIYLSSTGNLAHGRTEIWMTALKGFFESPIWGHGMATFQYYTGIVFPHNLFLQFMYDGGLILSVPLIVILIKGLSRVFTITRYGEKDKFVFILLLIGVALVRSMVSAEAWRIILLWLLFGIISQNSSKMEESLVEAE